MDSSPVIIDNATKFGRDLDPRTHFPGFPFDDEGGFGRRSDIRSHLDDLAARHPEFADHLLGSAWGEVPFSAGSLRRGNRRPSQERPSANNIFNNLPDEDARSQASGGSAASGASGVSSHGSEAEQTAAAGAAAAAAAAETDSSPSARKIPQYNLRNTVDIGQHQHNMEAPQQQRNVRSMSAPPENRQNEPRFVSRVDINPQQEAQQQQQQEPQQQQTQQEPQRDKSPPPQAQDHKTARQQSNVRQIPIFVEGRDKPVIAKEFDEPDFPRRQSPPQFTRPSQHYQSFNRQPSGWTSHFQEPFFEPPQNRWTNSPPSHPQFRQPQQQQQEKPRYTYQSETQPRARQQFQPHPQQPGQQQQQHQQQQQQHKPQQQHPQNEPQQEQAPPKPRQQVQPKDPLEKVAAVQTEVESLAEQVKEFSGNSRKDKQYMYLDEMLTRELIKLDDIDTEGKDNVRTARKQAIKSIQDTISLLESKAPLPGQQAPKPEEKQDAEPAKQEEQTVEQSAEKKEEAVAVKPDAMETQEAPAQEEQKAIPLPPPSTPTKEQSAAEPVQPPSEPAAATVVVVAEATLPQVQPEQAAQEPQVKSEPMDATPAPQEQQQQQQPQEQPMEVRQSSPAKELQLGKEDQQQSQALIAEEQKQEVKEAAAAAPAQPATEKPKKEPPPVPAKPNRPKKAKKAAKQQQQAEQQPVSEAAIPLPAPGQSI